MGFHNQPSYQADIEPVTAHVAAQYHNENGGSSFFVHGGERASTGFSVGGAGLPEIEHYNRNLSAEQFQANRDRVREHIKGQPATEQMTAVAGTWERKGVPGKRDAHVMDASNVIQSRTAATSLGRMRNEDAIYDLSDFSEISTR